MSDGDRRESKTLTLLLTAAATTLLVVFGLLWNANTDYVKAVDAKCIVLDEKKADKDFVKDIQERLNRIEKKLDKLSDE